MHQIEPFVVLGARRALKLRAGAKLSGVHAHVSTFTPHTASVGVRRFVIDPPFEVERTGWYMVDVDRETETATIRECTSTEVAKALYACPPSDAQIAQALTTQAST